MIPSARFRPFKGAIVSPADGKVTDISVIQMEGEPRTRISIFLNVFNVHVNRSPVSGIIEGVRYQKGKFGNAMGAVSAEQNEQNIVTMRTEDGTLSSSRLPDCWRGASCSPRRLATGWSAESAWG